MGFVPDRWKSDVSQWFRGLAPRYRRNSLTKCNNLGGDIFATEENLTLVKTYLTTEECEVLSKTRTKLLLYDSDIFDAESATVKWDFSSAIYNVIKRHYLLQTLIPSKGGNPVLGINVAILRKHHLMKRDNPLHLRRVVGHELVHCRQIADKELYTIPNGSFIYKGLVIHLKKSFVDTEALVKYQTTLPFEIPAYARQFHGLETNPEKFYKLLL